MRALKFSAICCASHALCQASFMQSRAVTTQSVTSVLKRSDRGTVGLELHLPPLAFTAFMGRDEMRYHLRRINAMLDTVISACANEALQLDYIALRHDSSMSTCDLWTDEERNMSLSFLRDVALHILPIKPAAFVLPITAAHKLPPSYVGGVFDMLHRIGWANVLLELPSPLSVEMVEGRLGVTSLDHTSCSRMQAALGGWQSLFCGLGNHTRFSVSQSVPLTTLFSWILQQGFLSRFCVGLFVDVHASMWSLSFLRRGEDVENNTWTTSFFTERVKKSDEKSSTSERPQERQRSPVMDVAASSQRGQNSQGAKELGDTTLSIPPKSFIDMFEAHHQSFLDTVATGFCIGGDRQDISMLAQFLHGVPNVHANNREPRLLAGKGASPENETSGMNTRGDENNMKSGIQWKSDVVYWQLLGELTKRSQAQYLCTTPCINPASLMAWQQARTNECKRGGGSDKDGEKTLPTSPAALLPVVSTLWPLLRPTQLERVRRRRSSLEDAMYEHSLADALKFIPQEIRQELQNALHEIPLVFLQGALRCADRRRRETEIHYGSDGVRLMCCNDDYYNCIDMLGSDAATRLALFSELPPKQAHHVRSVEENFRRGPMRKLFESMNTSPCTGDLKMTQKHHLLSVPRDTELCEMLESYRLLCLGDNG